MKIKLISPVNSHNEWDPLEEVIIGSVLRWTFVDVVNYNPIFNLGICPEYHQG